MQGRIVVILVALSAAQSLASAPFLPSSDDLILERLPRLEFARARFYPARSVETNIAVLAPRALEYINAYRASSDPRYLGYAQSILRPFWSSPGAPAEALVLRATIKQSLHDFDGALRDLDLAVASDPDNPQIWLTRSTILQVQGKLDEAKNAALRLLQIAPRYIAAAAVASVTSLNGQARQSFDLLEMTLRQDLSIPPKEKLWMLTIQGEIAAALGKTNEAERCFQEAFQIDPSDNYLLGAFADVMLDQGRFERVNDLLENEANADALLLRRTIARKRMNAERADQDIRDLAQRFAASHARGDAIHSREEARFKLELLSDPKGALELAVLNWRTQREPADARILLEAAIAARNPKAAEPVLQWIRETGIEHKRLRHLASTLHE